LSVNSSSVLGPISTPIQSSPMAMDCVISFSASGLISLTAI
jgi:hypothetical protein